MKRHLLRLLCFCTFCLSMITMQAQRNFRPGYIITLQQDTIYGEIDYRTDNMNELHCVFRADSTLQEVTYNPFEIWGYRFMTDGKMYVSKDVTLVKGETSRAVFLEYLVKGIKSLYYMDTAMNPTYFIEYGDVLVKVDAPRLAEKVVNFQFKGEKDRYIPILHYVFNDCPTLKSKIDRTLFNHKSLIELTKKYHYAMCTNNEACVEFVTIEDKNKVQIRLMPYAGVVQYKLVDIGPDIRFRQSDVTYLFGVNMAISSRRWMSSISGIIDVSFSQLKATDGTYSYSGTFYSPQLGVRYTYPKGRMCPFIGAGGDFNILISPELTNRYAEWKKAIYPGYYVEAGMDVQLSEKRKQALNIRFQFKNMRDVSLKRNFASNWSVTAGYVFQVH